MTAAEKVFADRDPIRLVQAIREENDLADRVSAGALVGTAAHGTVAEELSDLRSELAGVRLVEALYLLRRFLRGGGSGRREQRERPAEEALARNAKRVFCYHGFLPFCFRDTRNHLAEPSGREPSGNVSRAAKRKLRKMP